MKWVFRPTSVLPNATEPLLARARLSDGPVPGSGLLKPPLLPSQAMEYPDWGVMTTRLLCAEIGLTQAMKLIRGRVRSLFCIIKFQRWSASSRFDIVTSELISGDGSFFSERERSFKEIEARSSLSAARFEMNS